MSSPIRLLLLSEGANPGGWLQHQLETESIPCQVQEVRSGPAFEAALNRASFDLIVAETETAGQDLLEAVRMAKERQPDVPCVVVAANFDEAQAVECLKRGAANVVSKQRLQRLAPALRAALQEAEDQRLRGQAEASRLEAELRYRTELERRQEYFHALTELSSDVIAVADAAAEVRYVSSSVTRLLGYEPAELLNHHVLEIVHGDDKGLALDSLARLTATDMLVVNSEIRVQHKNGAWRVVEVVGRNLLNDSLVGGIILNIRDITERKKEQARIQEQAALLDKAQDAIMVSDLESKILYWNQSAERVYGWTASEAIGRNANDLLSAPPASEPVAAYKSLISRGEWQGELPQLTRAGQEIVVASRWSLVRDRSGKPESILVINTDITERKKLEAQFLRAQRMESLGALAGGIAHDLNNVLSPIIMVADLLRDTVKDAESQDWLNTLQHSAHHGAELVKQILSFARGAEGETVPIQVRHLISEHVKMLEETLPKCIRIKTRLDRDLWIVKGDPTHLTQVLMNLSVNARDAMANGGELQILASNLYVDKVFIINHPELRPGPHVRISVADTGTGIPKAVIGRIFEPFFTTKDVTKGTGLGLATSLGIVKRHHGTLTVYSEEGKGTQFNVYLPALLTNHIQQGELSKEPLARGAGECVLVVDDDGPVRAVTDATLRAQGYSTITARNGSEALTIFDQERDRIRVVLTDMMMPVMDGPALIKALRQRKPDVTVIAFSGMVGSPEAAELVNSGQVTFLPKPFTAEQLLTGIRNALGQVLRTPTT